MGLAGGPVPARVDGAVKAQILTLIENAASHEGWSISRACGVFGIDRRRVWRWQCRRNVGESLDDDPPGGNPIHGLLEWERTEIVAIFNEFADVDRSHRKLAHRGSYEGRVWVSPSTVDRVLTANGLVTAGETRPPASKKRPWPDWCDWVPNQLWVWDASQFEACETAKYAYGIIDLVSRKWITVTLTSEPDSLAVKVLFIKALESEGLLTDDLRHLLDDPDAVPPDDDDRVPMLLAISDNGTEMRSGDTRRLMALCSIAQHFGRPSTPTDQAWIESLWGHIKIEHPHLMTIDDPAVLIAELERIRIHYNGVRLHEGIGYVTPDDEHQGRGEHIRQARLDGMKQADQDRRAWHRQHRNQP